MKKAFRILIIFIAISVFIYLGAAYAMILFSNVKQPAHEQKSLDFEHIATDGQALPRLDEYESSDGTRLQYRHYEADTDSVLILLHGSGYHSSYLQPLAEHLSKEGIASVYTPDLRGHGRDTDKRGDIDYIGQIEHDLYDFIELVRGRHPGEAIVLGGHSSGGGTVIRIAGGEYSHEAVDKYLLIAPYIHHNAPTDNSGENGWANVNMPRMIGLSMLNQVGISHMNNRDVISFNMPEEYRDGTETLKYSYRMQVSMHPRDDYHHDIDSMEGDVLVLAGREDESFRALEYKTVFDDHDQVEVVLLDDLSHFAPIYDAEAHEAIGEWLPLQ